MMGKLRVLFVCIHNSARSQMAEAFLNRLGADDFIAESAGLEPGRLNPFVVEALQEVGIDIQGKTTNDVFNFFTEGRRYDYLVTVCDQEAAERCPIFPCAMGKIQWSFADPSSFTGSHEEILAQVRTVRDQIRSVVKSFISEHSPA